MIFYSFTFAIFFILVIAAMQLTKTERQQHIVFLLANAVFYGYWNVRFLALIAVVIAVIYFCALQYEVKNKNIYVAIPVMVCLGILGICKYMNFFIASFCTAFGVKGTHTISIILPLGISFYLCQALSYVLDVKNGTIVAEKNIIKLAVYISFFPQIISGPIVKAHDFLPQLSKIHRVKKANVYEGLLLFMTGLTKKIVFADRIGVAVDAVYEAPLAYSSVSVVWAVIGYAMQIYCDFSGYSDMALGIAKIMDFDLGKNFDLPYIARNLSDFWRRWHISLSSWFRDYVYIPLGGSRAGKAKTYFNLFITLLLSGLWHGASWTYVVWGALHGLGAVAHRIFKNCCGNTFDAGDNSRIRINAVEALSVVANFIFVAMLWVVFRADTMEQAMQVYRGMFRTGGIFYVNVYVVVYTVIIFVEHLMGKLKNKGHACALKLDIDRFGGKVILCTWIWLIVIFMYVGDSSFIYAQF
jgi:alginate O-acetyltransferase complex protein AlgI